VGLWACGLVGLWACGLVGRAFGPQQQTIFLGQPDCKVCWGF